MSQCTKCAESGLSFDRPYEPVEFLEGRVDSRIWIIGLNPANDLNYQDTRTTEELAGHLDDLSAAHSYFKDFRAVSPWLYERLGKSGGVGHTDLVKCFSRSWPPDRTTSSQRKSIIANCRQHLVEQLVRLKPEILVCNGAEVCLSVQELIPAPPGTPRNATSYRGELGGRAVVVILSGFIGRIDNFARRRLGLEIEQWARDLGLDS